MSNEKNVVVETEKTGETVNSLPKLAEKLGTAIKRSNAFSDSCPVGVYEIKTVDNKDQIEGKSRPQKQFEFFVKQSLNFSDGSKTFSGGGSSSGGAWDAQELERCYVGYDIEYYTGESADDHDKREPKLLSHQFYFVYNGQRKGFVYLTDIRFTEDALVRLIANAVPDGTKIKVKNERGRLVDKFVPVKNVYICAHYSHAEAGWLRDGRTKPSGHAQRQEKMHIAPAYWLFDEVKERLKAAYNKVDPSIDRFSPNFYFEYDKLVATEDLVARFPIPLLKKRDRKWVGKVPLFSRSDIENYRALGSVVAKRYKTLKPGKTEKALGDRGIAIERLVYKHFKGGARAVLETVNKIVDEEIKKSISQSAEWLAIDEANVACLREMLESINPLLKSDFTTAESVGYSALKRAISSCLPKRHKKSLHLADSMDLLPASLTKVGDLIGIDKVSIEQDEIEDMEQFLKKDEEKFLEYAFRDAIVTVESQIFFARHFWDAEQLKLNTRAAGYSAALFSRVFANDIVRKTGRDIKYKELLGWEHQLDALGDETSTLWPGAAMELFAQYYFGGWAAAHAVGKRGECVYHDLKSAFPCAIGMLRYDYNFGESRVYRGKEAIEFVRQLMKDGPFQVAGVCCSFVFHEFHPVTGRPVEPIFPIKVDKTWLPPMSISESNDIMLFPRRGYAHVAWPEFYTAFKGVSFVNSNGKTEQAMNLLESVEVHHVATFQVIDRKTESVLAKETMRLIEQRGVKGNRDIYKILLNYFYGKSAEGIGKKTVVSKTGVSEKRRLPGVLTCFPIASYTTSVCRAVIGELLQKHECYAIATDGFISPNKEVEYGEIGGAIQERIGSFVDYNETYMDAAGEVVDGWKDPDGVVHPGKPYEFIERDYAASESLFLKTRGYALVGYEEFDESVKLAQMSVQLEERDKKSEAALVQFLERLITGAYVKKSTKSLTALKKDGKDELPLKEERNTNVNTCYDFKRIPEVDGLKDDKFEFKNQAFECVSFDTRPLESVEDFIILRMFSRGLKVLSADGYRALLERFYNSGYGLYPH